jgi:hypothetical protein
LSHWKQPYRFFTRQFAQFAGKTFELVNISAIGAQQRQFGSSRHFARNALSHSKAPLPARLPVPTVPIAQFTSTQPSQHIAVAELFAR